jgi:hypothetical protein
MTNLDLLECILNRLGQSAPAEELFGANDEEHSPSGLFDALTHQGLFQQAQHARQIECTGCEENCVMPVQILTNGDGHSTKAFIACDKRDDIGRVQVDLTRLKQWKTTNTLLAYKLSELLGFEKPPKELDKGNRWALGTLKGKKHNAMVLLIIENGVSLQVAGHRIPLTEVLTLNGNILTLDKSELLRRVNQPVLSSASTYKPSKVRQESRKFETQQMYKAWQKAYVALKKKHPDKSDAWCSQQIAKMPIAQGRDSETIRKNMKK